jgi:hypothetical protein
MCVPPCSGANSVVSLACICFLLLCQFLPDHAKIVRFRSLNRTTYSCVKDLRIQESAAFLSSPVNTSFHG